MHPDPHESDERREEELLQIAALARRAGMPLERLAELLRALERAATDTRRMLARDVYGVPEDLLDDVLRIRLEEQGDDHD